MKEDKELLSPSDMIAIGFWSLVFAVICFFGGQDLIGTGSLWVEKEEDIRNGTRLVYLSFFSGFVGGVFLLAGLIKMK